VNRSLAAGALACLALGAAAPKAPDAHAAELFEQAIHEYDRREYDAAATDLKRAYELSPSYPVLYNLALAYAASHHPSAAIAAFERYLTDGGGEIDGGRRKAVTRRIAELSGQTGLVMVNVSPSRAAVHVDGDTAELAQGTSLRLDGGRHTLTLDAEGFEPYSSTLVVEPGERLHRVDVQLRPSRPADVTPPGFLRIECPVPGVSVHLDGVVVSTTPVAGTLRTGAGAHRLAFARRGYSFPETTLPVTPGELTLVSCDASRSNRSAEDRGARVRFARDEPRATVDGAPYYGELLASGVHRVRLARAGERPWSEDVSLHPSEVRLLTPDSRKLHDTSSGKADARTWAAILAGTGAALGIAAGVIAVVDGNRFDDWQRRDSELKAHPDGTSRAKADNDALARSIAELDGVALGLAIGGGCLVSAGGALWALSLSGAPAHTAAIRWSGVW